MLACSPSTFKTVQTRIYVVRSLGVSGVATAGFCTRVPILDSGIRWRNCSGTFRSSWMFVRSWTSVSQLFQLLDWPPIDLILHSLLSALLARLSLGLETAS